MGNFENYASIQKNQQKQINTQEESEQLYQSTYNVEKETGLGANVEAPEVSAEYITEQFQERIEQSEFEERTQYYFEDSRYMEAKAERYRALADDENNEVAVFAEQHTYRSAKKRKKKAKEAAAAFKKAQKIEEKLNKDREKNGDSGISPLQQYWNRNEIMRARMEGMIAAAKVKATNKNNEEYRIAKAKLSCLTLLLDQAKNLQDEASQEKFQKIQKNLEGEIAGATETLKKYSQDIWKDRVGVNEPGILDKLKKEKKNDELRIEEVEASLMLSSMGSDFTRPEYVEAAKHTKEVFGTKPTARKDEIVSMIYYVKRDKNGKPLNKEELKKEKWNNEWLKACSDKTKEDDRRRMITESMSRVKDVPLPTVEEVKKNGVMYYIKRDARVYEVIQKSLRIDNVKTAMPFVIDFMNADRLVKAKLDYAVYLGMIFKDECSKLAIRESEAGKMYVLQTAPTSSVEKREKDFVENSANAMGFLEDAEKDLVGRHETGFPVSYEEAQKSAASNNNEVFNEKSYEIYRSYANSSQVLECPTYTAIFAPVKRKLGTNKDMSRLCGSMFRTVHFDKHWQPISEKDKEAHAWNLKYLDNLVKYIEDTEVKDGEVAEKELDAEKEKERNQAADTLKTMIEEETARYFLGQFNLPNPEQLRKEFVEPLKNGEPINCERIEQFLKNTDELAIFYTKTLALEGTYKNLPFLKDFSKQHPAYDACQDMQTVFTTFLIPTYSSMKYGVSMNASSSVEQLTKKGMSFDSPESVEPFIAMYEEKYNAYLDAIKKQFGGSAAA